MAQEMAPLQRGKVGTVAKTGEPLPNPIEPHVAESKWQFCNCRSCQEKRALILSMPGKEIDFAKYRRSDERY